ncbi:hypothetical protein M947_00325 [Sulfurimonas hongkongensis]|uniref:Uncharacterized protein n=1 Tax=Sulfurimonas hongkongensis TaxID=1172190 RepID=T0JI32_9BACT|nr:DsrE family protein [Sulfurimonas hongkongensis]EQB40730.1 hypothetical protein M947_00325 [Sulfurimonas hongkongensis]
MATLIILNHQPYDGSDITYNALRLVKTLHKRGEVVQIFIMNDGVDLARDNTLKPEFYDFDLVAILKELYHDGVALKVCGTCQARCGLNKNEPYFDKNIKATMQDLASWTMAADRVLTF